MMKLFFYISVFLLSSIYDNSLHASIENAYAIYKRNKSSDYHLIAENLVRQELFFTAVPFIKEYMTRTSKIKDTRIDKLIDIIAINVGIKQFEVLPERILKKSRAPAIRYILAKKMFRLGRYREALSYLNATIPGNHKTKPFALMLEGSIYSMQKRYSNAIGAFEECVNLSDRHYMRARNKLFKKQLEINRDYCYIGIPRSKFAQGKYKEANRLYDKLTKNSYIWPEILFEEAWNSFYRRDYNRTLGKLATYDAPLLNYIFNPEAELLEGLTYLELCLWNDAKIKADQFYSKYQSSHKRINNILKDLGDNYYQYFLIIKSYQNGRERGNRLLNRQIEAISRDMALVTMINSYEKGKGESIIIRRDARGKFERELLKSLNEALGTQKKLIGAYVKKSLTVYNHQLKKAFKSMSYIKLEVLSKSKRELYRHGKVLKRGRGDIANLVVKNNQYFWSFNGEFWADELGDYVFSLKSECSK